MTIYGLDFSHYDAVPAGSRVVSEGFKFMTHKAGGDANDAELGAWWSALKPYRDQVLLGAYWVLYPGSPSSRADAFLARLDSQCGGWRDGPFILQVDCEEWNDDPGTAPSKTDIDAFCDRLRSKMPKLRPIVYAPKWVYGNRLNGLDYPLWASGYVAGSGSASGLYPGDGSSKWGAYSGQVPAILQFTSSANALGQSTCDANAFRGTFNELVALVAPGWVEDMAGLEDADVTKIVNAVWAKADTATIRNGRTIGGTLDALANYAVAAAGGPAAIAALGAEVETLAAGTDPAALAAALAPLLADVSPAELQEAIVGALRELAAPAAEQPSN